MMPIFELVQEMFVNTCVKFRANWLRTEVCRSVMPFCVCVCVCVGGGGGAEAPYQGVTCDL